MLNDLFGYFKRNLRNMSNNDIIKLQKELNNIVRMIERDIDRRSNKNEGVGVR